MECILIILLVIFMGIIYLKYVERKELNKLEQEMIYKQKLIENISNKHKQNKYNVYKLRRDKMLNAEKHKKEILDITEEGYNFAVSKDRQNIVKGCNGNECENCIFDDNYYGCDFSRTKWLLSEYKENIKLTRLEFEMLKWLEKEGYKFIIRNPNDNPMAYDSKPEKVLHGWVHGNRYKLLSSFDELFQFVRREDEEPTSIQDVLKNCEVMDDDTDKR